jgi:hypothetical protein
METKTGSPEIENGSIQRTNKTRTSTYRTKKHDFTYWPWQHCQRINNSKSYSMVLKMTRYNSARRWDDKATVMWHRRMWCIIALLKTGYMK